MLGVSERVSGRMREGRRHGRFVEVKATINNFVILVMIIVSVLRADLGQGSLGVSAISGKIVRISIDTSNGIVPTFRRVVGSPVGSHVIRICGQNKSSISINAPVLGLSLRDTRARCGGRLSRRRVGDLRLRRRHIAGRGGLSRVRVGLGISHVRLSHGTIRLHGRHCLSDLKTNAASGIHRIRLSCGIDVLGLGRSRRGCGGRRTLTRTSLGMGRLRLGVFHGDLTRAQHALRSTRVHSPHGTVLACIGGRVNSRVNRKTGITVISSLSRFGVRNRVTSACKSHVTTNDGTIVGVNDRGLSKAIDSIAPLSGGNIVSFAIRLRRSGRGHLHSNLGASICIVGTIGSSILHVTGSSCCIKGKRCRLFIMGKGRLLGHGIRLKSDGFRCMRIIDNLRRNSRIVISSVGTCGSGGGLGVRSWHMVMDFVVGRCVGRSVRVLGRGHLIDIVSVTNATVSVTVVVIMILIFRVRFTGFCPRGGHSQVVCISDKARIGADGK